MDPYCSRCGNRINTQTGVCVVCGWQSRALKRIWGQHKQAFLRFGLLVLLAAALVSMGARQQSVIAQKDAEIKALQEEKEDLINIAKEGVTIIRERGAEMDRLAKNLDEWGTELEFLRDHAAIVTANDKFYHHYSCPKWKTQEEFYIYNTEAAELKGKTPCPGCWESELSPRGSFIDQVRKETEWHRLEQTAKDHESAVSFYREK